MHGGTLRSWQRQSLSPGNIVPCASKCSLEGVPSALLRRQESSYRAHRPRVWLASRQAQRCAIGAWKARVRRDFGLHALTVAQGIVLEQAAREWVRLRSEVLTDPEQRRILERVSRLLTKLRRMRGAVPPAMPPTPAQP